MGCVFHASRVSSLIPSVEISWNKVSTHRVFMFWVILLCIYFIVKWTEFNQTIYVLAIRYKLKYVLTTNCGWH